MTWSFVLLPLAGLLWWTLLEYLLHRFAFHRRNRFFGRRHLQHHAKVQERRLAIAPPGSILGGAALHAVLLFTLFEPLPAALFLAGFLAGYVAYELVHYAVHYRPQRTRVGRWLRAYHLLHHHKTPRARFGVTSPLWDLVFGTYAPVPRPSHAS